MLANKPIKSESVPEFLYKQPQKKSPSKAMIISIVAIIAVLGTIWTVTGWSTKPPEKAGKKAIPVSIATAIQKSIPLEINVIGTVQPYATVQVKSQVIGQLVKVHFKQGDFVKAGDVLFTIDPRALSAQLAQSRAMERKDEAQVRQALANVQKDAALVNQAAAAMARDRSQLALAQREAERYLTLASQGAVSREQYDQQKTNELAYQQTVNSDEAALESAKATLEADKAVANSLKAQVNADEAAVQNAQVQLSYTVIRSPIDGRTGTLNINEGNLIKDNDVTSLISIDQINPIYVSFAIPEQYFSEITRYNKEAPLQVLAFLASGKTPETGVVTFIDNSVDSTTGTINLKGTFANLAHRLWPGQFVNVVLVLKEEPNAMLIPAHALQSGQDGQFVFVLKANSTVEQRPVKVERNAKGYAVILQGINAGEKVVTDGQMQLVDGSLVEPKAAVSQED